MKPSLTKQKRYLEILEDTVKFYKKNPRSVNVHGQCSYLSPDGARCAVGRYISEENIQKLGNLNGSGVDSLIDEFGGLDTILVDSVQGLDEAFWSNLQGLHDSRQCWDGNKLTKYGRDTLALLRSKWAPDLITPKRNTRTKK